MTKAHPHRQVNVHLDIVDDADIIERIEAQPSMVGYIRELVRRDIHDERLDYAALKASELQAENAKLRWLAAQMGEMLDCVICDRNAECDWRNDGPCWYEIELRKLGVEVSE